MAVGVAGIGHWVGAPGWVTMTMITLVYGMFLSLFLMLMIREN
jgi:hypothetical protein